MAGKNTMVFRTTRISLFRDGTRCQRLYRDGATFMVGIGGADKMREYPEYCAGCWNEKKCQQKEFMVANTEAVPGFVGCADTWCKEHAPKNSESAGYYPESDTPMHCAKCGRPLQCSLTDYGVKYIKETIKSGEGCCLELWPVLFVEYL